MSRFFVNNFCTYCSNFERNPSQTFTVTCRQLPENISLRYYFLDNKSLLRFQFIYGKQSQAFNSFRAVWRSFSNLRPTPLTAILLRDFWFGVKARKGACTVISRLFPRSVDIVAWPVQRRFARRAKFQKLFNDKGEIRSNLGYSGD